MQTLNLSESSTRSESRIKSLFWPEIQNGSDVDYLGAQGYWICTLVSVVSFVLLMILGRTVTAVLIFLLFYVGGLGVRERSRYAATIVFAMYLLDTLFSPGVVRILFSALLLSNVRATWIAANWRPDSEDSVLPPRFSETWIDKFGDVLPAKLWPKLRIPYYIFSAGYFVVVALGIVLVLLGKAPTGLD